MPRKLSETRIRILRRLASKNYGLDCCETGSEIGVALGIKSAGPTLASLDSCGLVEHVGWAPNNARTWTITEAGRAALAQAEPR